MPSDAALETRERLAAVEVSLEHVNRCLDDMSPKVSAMHDLMMKA
jgi:hypothetical protein